MSGLAVLLVGVSSWRSVIRLSCGVAVCLPSSFARRLVRFSSLRLVCRLVACPSCPAGCGGGACLLVPSCLFFSWGVAVRGAGASCRDCPSHLWLLFSCRVAWRRARIARRLVLSSRCSSRGAGRLLLLVLSRRLRMVGGSRLVVSGAGVCLPSLPSWDVAMPFSSSVFPLGSSSPVSCSRRHRSCLVSLARFETAGREARRRLLAWVSTCGSSCLVDECI